MAILIPPIHPFKGLRTIDAYGAGGFGAPRGFRKHSGIDILGDPGDPLFSPLAGHVVHIGIAYSDADLGSIHIVGVGKARGFKVKLLYGKPMDNLSIGTALEVGEPIGTVQDVAEYHFAKNPKPERMQNHIHMEVYQNSHLIDPNHVLDFPPLEI